MWSSAIIDRVPAPFSPRKRYVKCGSQPCLQHPRATPIKASGIPAVIELDVTAILSKVTYCALQEKVPPELIHRDFSADPSLADCSLKVGLIKDARRQG